MGDQSRIGANTIIIVEDNPVFRKGLFRLLVNQDDLDVVSTADSAEHGLAVIEKWRPDLAIIDISLGGADGIELIGEMRRRGISTRVMVLSMHEEPHYARRALENGAAGYLIKQEAPEEILAAVRAVLGGKEYLSASMAGPRA